MDKVQQSRRTFLKTAAAVAAAAPLAGCGVMDAQAKDVTWNREADVVVLGYGNAGTNAAIEAHDAGASVIVLEKMSIGSGNVAVSAGGFVIPTNRDAYFTYLKSLYELSRSEWDEGILNVFCDESMKLGDWMKKLDPRAEVGVYGHAGYQQLPGADSVNKCSLRGVPGLKGGDRLFNTFDRSVKARNIPVLFNTLPGSLSAKALRSSVLRPFREIAPFISGQRKRSSSARAASSAIPNSCRSTFTETP